MALGRYFEFSGIDKMLAVVGVMTEKAETAATSGRAAIGDELLRLSNIEVPLDEGTLANTGISEPEGKDHIVAYNTPYAAKLHENPDFAFGNNRKGKFLEDPIKHNLKEFQFIFGKEFEAGLKI